MRFSEFRTLKEESALLRVPTSSTDIANLQKALAAFKYNVNTTGDMDDLTSAALSKAQQEMGLPVSGKPDAITIDAMNKAIAEVPGMSDYMSRGAMPNMAAKSPTTDAKSATTDKPKPADSSNQKFDTPQSDLPSSTDKAYTDGKSVIIGNKKRTGGTISWRTNNPGNVAYGPRAKSFGALGFATAADGEKVAIMPTLEHGWKMQMALWRSPNYNNGTIDHGCRRWATGVGSKKETSPYTISLANAAGASIHTNVSDLSDEQLKNMVMKQAELEGFKVGTITTV